MTIEGEGAGKGDVFRKIDRLKFCKNYDHIKFETVKHPEYYKVKNGKWHKVYPEKIYEENK